MREMKIIDANDLMRDIERIRAHLMANGYGKEASTVSLAMDFLNDWINDHEINVERRPFPQEEKR